LELVILGPAAALEALLNPFQARVSDLRAVLVGEVRETFCVRVGELIGVDAGPPAGSGLADRYPESTGGSGGPEVDLVLCGRFALSKGDRERGLEPPQPLTGESNDGQNQEKRDQDLDPAPGSDLGHCSDPARDRHRGKQLTKDVVGRVAVGERLGSERQSVAQDGQRHRCHVVRTN
jgi:hypothetical protein